MKKVLTMLTVAVVLLTSVLVVNTGCDKSENQSYDEVSFSAAHMLEKGHAVILGGGIRKTELATDIYNASIEFQEIHGKNTHRDQELRIQFRNFLYDNLFYQTIDGIEKYGLDRDKFNSMFESLFRPLSEVEEDK
ncbi:MAG: hypothetical protein R2883_01650 [Caldisericia bacterium]